MKGRGKKVEVFSISIDRIHKEKEGKRVVFATIDTSFYDGKHKGVQCAFLKSGWDRIKAKMQYQEWPHTYKPQGAALLPSITTKRRENEHDCK